MELFEFLMILVSVVIGLGLTEILNGMANLLRVRHTVHFYWLHTLFQFAIFFALIQQWWESWDLHAARTVTFGEVLLLLAPPVVLYLIAHLLYPKPSEGADLDRYYYQQAPLLWGLVVAGTVEGAIVRPLALGYSLLEPANLSSFPTIALAAVLMLSGNRRLHSVVGPIIFVLVILDTILANPAISVG